MRSFSNAEKEIIISIVDNDGKMFEELFLDLLGDIKLVIKKQNNEAFCRYRTNVFAASPSEIATYQVIANSFYTRLFYVTVIVDYFKNNGYLSLYRNEPLKDEIALGATELVDAGFSNDISDEVVKGNLFEFVNSRIIVSEGLRQFVKNDFRTNEAIDRKKTLQLAWISSAIALFVGVLGFVASYNPGLNDEIGNFKSQLQGSQSEEINLLRELAENSSLSNEMDSLLLDLVSIHLNDISINSGINVQRINDLMIVHEKGTHKIYSLIDSLIDMNRKREVDLEVPSSPIN